MVVQLSVSGNPKASKLQAKLGAGLEFDKNLALLSGYGTGGSATFFYRATSAEELSLALIAANELSIPTFLLGGGTNILVSDEGFEGLVIKTDVTGLELVSDDTIECGAGESLSAVVDFAADNGLSGMEFASGIFGTLGGAICGNAGAFGSDMSQVVDLVTLVDRQGKISSESNDYCRFEYRNSYFKKSGEAIVKAVIKLKKGQAESIKAEIKRIIDLREEKHPTTKHTAGCFFKNVCDPNDPTRKRGAGQLLDQAGAKIMKVGQAEVSDQHANIIVNLGHATSKDISVLADRMKQSVKDKFGITLDEEVVRVGKF